MFCYSVDSEYRQLKAVLLCKPHPKIDKIDNPGKALHLAKIDYAIIKNEFEQLIKLYKKLKIKVVLIDPFQVKSSDAQSVFNLVFTREHLFMTGRGAIMARMFSDIRRSEVKYAKKTLKAAGVGIRKVIQGSGTFEGADALWVTSKLVIVGVGKRTNLEGFCQVMEELKKDSIKCVGVPVPGNALHLLGALQFVDADTALVRAGSANPEVINLLRKNKIKTIMVAENSEVREKQAMNFVAIAPREIIMPADCPQTKKFYEKSRIKIAAEIRTPQLVRGAGGIGCATGILARA